jgi:hypothetical protein
MRVWAGGKLPGAIAVLCFGIITVLTGANAESDADKQKLYQCAKDICNIILSKKASGPDLACDVTKTWEDKEIEKGASSKSLSWGLGTAQCHFKLTAKRSAVLAALNTPENTFRADRQTVACVIGTEKYPIHVTLAPEVKFKNGVASQVSLNVDEVRGAPLIEGAVWTVSMLERNFGILQGDMIREVNRFIHKECPKVVQWK